MGLDSSRLRLRVQAVGAGVWVTYLLCLALAGWLVVTWDRPYRETIAALIAAGVLAAFTVSRLPAERIVRGHYREAFFVTWSVIDVAIICLIAYLDGGLTSPAALMLFLTLVFAATSYPLGSMVVVVVASVTGVATIGLLGGATERAFKADPAYVWVFLVSMALCGVLCMWQSRLGERHREELAELSRTDPLTGCLNRRGFAERLDAELARAGRDGGEVALDPARPQRVQGRQRPARSRRRRRAAALGRLDARRPCCAARTPPAAWAATSSRCCCRA